MAEEEIPPRGAGEKPDATETIPIQPSESRGAVIGSYKLLQLIGEGGMGVVWLAEQRSPLRRQVALKLIRAGMNSQEVTARFESERQALALMDHPAIAKIFDGGSTAAGVPYFVMEYVPGISITDYCDKHRLSMRDRLDLFSEVCHGVHHAHQKAIIHRDLKPSNILVTEVDGKAVPKIIDFGVAKAISHRLTAQTMFTQLGVLIGTPEYMSPEQADLGIEGIDTRADIYSLGVILYELLVGTRPLEFADIKNLAFHELLRRLREDEPPRPSTKLRTLRDRSSQTAQNRRSEPAALGRQLRGDLDAIALKSLAKDRNRRYASASELAADIARYLGDEPVVARAPSLTYRARKFVRRYRAAVAVTVVLAVAIVGLAVTMTVQSARVARERDRANREAAAAEQVANFLVGLFKISDPDEARGNRVTAREILDKGARDVERELAGQKQLQARIMATIGQVYAGLGLYGPATDLVNKALQLQQRVLGPDNRTALETERLLARLAAYQGRYQEAEKIYGQVWDAQRRTLGADSQATLQTESGLGSLYAQEGRYDDAVKILTRAVDTGRRSLGAANPTTLQSMHSLAIAYDGLHKYEDEQRLWSELLQVRERSLGTNHPDTIDTASNLAYVYFRLGKLKEAEKLQRENLEKQRQVKGNDHPDTFTTIGNLANTLAREHRLQEAEALQREALQGRERVLGPDNPDTFFAVNNLAEVLEGEGKYEEAQMLFRKALEGERRVLGENHPELAYVWLNLGGVAALQGHRAEAIEGLRQAVAHGYSDANELSGDEAWKSVRTDPQYKLLVSEIQARAQSKSK
jgi:non-specific serine/threonine protein kinase/serine/threonine-protein kinase